MPAHTPQPPIERHSTREHVLGVSVERFLHEYWQKHPLLVRGAFAGIDCPITPDDLAGLGRSMNHMADELGRKIQQLENLSLVQRQFVSDVSHELRTPLNAVIGFSEAIMANPTVQSAYLGTEL